MRQRRKGMFRFCLFSDYNWCGPGCSGPGKPVNEVDAACKAHDQCYQRGGRPCECDREFLRRLRSEIDPATPQGRHARMLYQYMKMQSFFTCGF
ncbi:phospholipase [Sporosarcina sp. Te-1]|uniref:phospholipase n=1 Tax=Sporosarcina sp. Te-1 TaxID=2818390 RepID=UPI001AA009D9|nr:phospholipase [Sporosarcina sp. Te-1]QTD42989.1 phospholipase [Sporosarcina sp. Te-1]